MTPIAQILARHFPEQKWRVTLPEAGLQKEAYLIESERHRLFLKFATPSPAWERLAVLGAAPRLLAKGTYAGRPYVIQRFVEGSHPDRVWFVQHVTDLARFFRRFHGDRPLAQLLAPAHPGSSTEQVAQEVAALAEALTSTRSAHFDRARFRQSFRLFAEQAQALQVAPPVPVHPDPSLANMLITGRGLIMVDWDGVLLSNPLRDLGPVAWWYLPQRQWSAFFEGVGTPVDRDGTFWWAARRSLEVALWFDARQAREPAHAFLADFHRAVAQRDNPQVLLRDDEDLASAVNFLHNP